MEKKKWLPFIGLSTCLIFIMVSFIAINFWVFPQNADAADSKKMIFMTLPQGTSSYNLTVAFSQLANQKTNLETSVEPVPAPIAQVLLVAKGEAQLVITASDGLYWAYHGGGGSPGYNEGWSKYDKPQKDLRLLCYGYDYFWVFYTLPKSGIKTISDLKGRKVSTRYPGWTITNYGKAMLEAYGLDPKNDINPMTFPRSNIAQKAMMDGIIDAVLDMPIGARIREMEAKKGMRTLPVDPSKIDYVKRVCPTAKISMSTPVVGGTKESGPIPLVTVPVAIAANKSISDDAAYQIVKAVMENNAHLKRIDPSYAYFNIDRAIMETFPIPYHPGAIRYYKEKGIWKAAEDAKQAKVLNE
ncbi:MAG: TAXI family TRAP transporter solute-binding subunit [Planctomycetota bacterium]|nr:MAG: TAXI family TRAP transporter solute-binding subunit [Planctomycetota bacterium]